MTKPTNGGGQRVYDPRGVVDAQPRPITARPGSLKGLRLGVLDNTKWNARRLLQGATEILQRELGLGKITFYQKESFSKAAAPEIIAKIAAENDIALTAIGD